MIGLIVQCYSVIYSMPCRCYGVILVGEVLNVLFYVTRAIYK
jgi:hypothetical protein